jgi:uncharacterized protein YegL
MQKVADENPNALVLVRAIKFSNGAQWHISQPTQIQDFKWSDLNADGVTDLGKALRLLADQLRIPPMSERALPPVLVLASDGQPTDDFAGGLKAVMDLPWGKKAVRVSIAIGADADLDVLEKFIGNSELRPLQANNPESLVRHIKWVSTAVLKSASQPPSQVQGAAPAGNVPLPPPPPDPTPGGSTDNRCLVRGFDGGCLKSVMLGNSRRQRAGRLPSAQRLT